jgi:hypothetical protein
MSSEYRAKKWIEARRQEGYSAPDEELLAAFYAGRDERRFIPPETGDIIPVLGSVLVVTSVNIEAREGTFRVFETPRDAVLWKHDRSLDQYPDWHAAHCDYCKSGVYPV